MAIKPSRTSTALSSRWRRSSGDLIEIDLDVALRFLLVCVDGARPSVKGTCGSPSAVSTHVGNAKTNTVSHTLVRVDIRPGGAHASASGPIKHPLLPQNPFILERMTESTVGDIVISLVRLCLPI